MLKKVLTRLLHDDNQSITNYFERIYKKPVFILNDVKGAAYAELKFGLAKTQKQFNYPNGLGDRFRNRVQWRSLPRP
jgi:predicted NBD/HSP70 family sugar kinase